MTGQDGGRVAAPDGRGAGQPGTGGRFLRWGVLGGARIAEHFVLPAMAGCPQARVTAVASRRPDAGERLARDHGARPYGSYAALLDDPRVDAVYVALPNALHTRWTLAALAAGKHVLCEKPLATTSADAQAVAQAAAAAGRVVRAGYMYRCHPQFAELRRQVREGVVGEVRMVEAALSFVLDDPSDIRMSPALGGGALLDLGCYPVDAANVVFGRSPAGAAAVPYVGATGVDLHSSGVLDYGGGRTALVTASFLLPWQDSHLTVRGEKGSLVLDHCFNPGTGEGRMTRLTAGGERTVTTFPGVDMYARMLADFSAAVHGEPGVLPDPVQSLGVQHGLELLAGQGPNAGTTAPVHSTRQDR